jgi:hypothetical protein
MTTKTSSAGAWPAIREPKVPSGGSTAAALPPGIDPELAAMLEREVRAGAPPIESIESIVLPAAPAIHIEGASTPPTPGAPGASPARAAIRGASTTDEGAASPEDAAIDLPLPAAEMLPVQPPASFGGQPLQPPMRIGAVIIDGSATPGTPASEVGPAGELIVAEQAPLPAVIMPGQREVLPPGPGVRPPGPPAPQPQQFAEDQRTIIINRLNEVRDAGWQKTLHQQIDELFQQVVAEFSSPPGSADQMLTLLQEARQILLESPENYVAAEYRMAQVRSTMARMRESRRESARLAPRVFVYEVVWLGLLLLGLVGATPLTGLMTRAGSIAGATASDLFPFWNTLMWGGIGGVIGALYALWWHVSDQQDFDRQYLMWYLVQPIMGVVLGGIVFLLLTGGFLLLQIQPSEPNAGARLLPYLVAVLAGFRQNFIYGQFDRLIGLFAPAGSQNSSQG